VTAIATGRSLYSFLRALKALDRVGGIHLLPVDYIIFSTGAGILDVQTNRVIFQKSIPPEKIRKITDYLDSRQFDYMVHKAIPETHSFLYRSFGQENSDFYNRIKLYNDYAAPLINPYQYTDAATQVLSILPGSCGLGQVESIQNNLNQFSVIHATSPLDHQSIWIEIFHKDVSKSRTAGFLARQHGVEPADVISVGNDYNDLDLLGWSGQAFIVENGPDSMKKKFQVVPSNNHGGVTRAVIASGVLNQGVSRN
jgi:hydroxymethylpyrimidine pyrophosphatase-like HAD family hydrolase